MNEFAKSGYTVIKNWLSSYELEEFLKDYKQSSVTDNQNYNISCASVDLLKKLKHKIDVTAKSTGLDVDLLTPGALYTDTSWVDWGWHQDHESFYTLQQHENYLNFYVIISKEDPKMSGLSIVPMDALQSAIPELMHLIVNRGASAFFPEDDHTVMRSDETGAEYQLPVNIDTLAVHPELSAGDLLLIRGDVIHRTQDAEKQRTAVSIRYTKGNAPISRAQLLSGCDFKRNMIKNNQRTYDSILEKFNTQDVVTAFDLYGEMK